MCWPASRLLSNLCRTHLNSGTSRISPGIKVSVPLQLRIDQIQSKYKTTTTTKQQVPADISASLCAAISVLKDREPGCFIVRDSHSFRGAYGLAMKVATPPPSVLQQSKKGITDLKRLLYNTCLMTLSDIFYCMLLCLCHNTSQHVRVIAGVVTSVAPFILFYFI